jgi:hypothetical protein
MVSEGGNERRMKNKKAGKVVTFVTFLIATSYFALWAITGYELLTVNCKVASRH